jgi:F0F1-type ATP synthase epsilon subunit
MFPPLRVRIMTPGETVLDVADVHWVQARLADGADLGIWPGHGPLLAETVDAPLRYQDEAGAHSVWVKAGVLYITPGIVTIYTSMPWQPTQPSDSRTA